jgi:hypothetical protein
MIRTIWNKLKQLNDLMNRHRDMIYQTGIIMRRLHALAVAHPAVPGWSICSMRVPCAGDLRRARGGALGGSGAIAERVSDELSGRHELCGVLVRAALAAGICLSRLRRRTRSVVEEPGAHLRMPRHLSGAAPQAHRHVSQRVCLPIQSALLPARLVRDHARARLAPSPDELLGNHRARQSPQRRADSPARAAAPKDNDRHAGRRIKTSRKT